MRQSDSNCYSSVSLEVDLHGTTVCTAAQSGNASPRKKDKSLKRQFASDLGLEEQQTG